MIPTTVPVESPIRVTGGSQLRISDALVREIPQPTVAARAAANGLFPEDAVLRGSWARCQFLGLRRDALCRPVSTSTIWRHRPESSLLRMVAAVMGRRQAELQRSESCLCFTDADGVVVRQVSGSETLAERLFRLGIRTGFSIAEEAIGTSGATTLLTREPVFVCGDEHYASRLDGMASAGMAVVHPITKRMVGSLVLWCASQHSSPVGVSWVRELVREIERLLAEGGSSADRVLLDRYLRESRDARHPVVVLNEHTIVTNAAAARVLAPVDQAMLWEHASRMVRGEDAVPSDVEISGGRAARVECSFVAVEDTNIGVVMRLKRIRPRRPGAEQQQLEFPQLAGSSSRWQAMCRSLAIAGSAPILLVGEPGTGKTSIARCLASGNDVVEVDAGSWENIGSHSWLIDLERILQRPGMLVLLHLDELAPAMVDRLVALVEKRSPATRLVATSRTGAGTLPPIVEELGHLVVTVEVPALRDRLEDIPDLVGALGARYHASHPVSVRTRWMTDALQALARIDWPRNIATLEALVSQVLSRATSGYIGVRDLPPQIVARASRRQLHGLQQVEAGAILRAIHDAGGNKQRAAEELGIARSTLYRKIRSLGIGLDVAAY